MLRLSKLKLKVMVKNVDLAGASLNDPTLDGHEPNLDNIVFYDNDNESSGEELDGDEEDGGDYFIRGLDGGD